MPRTCDTGVRPGASRFGCDSRKEFTDDVEQRAPRLRSAGFIPQDGDCDVTPGNSRHALRRSRSCGLKFALRSSLIVDVAASFFWAYCAGQGFAIETTTR